MVPRPRLTLHRASYTLLLPLLALAGALILQLQLLRGMDYSKASLGSVPTEEALSPGDPLRLGSLSWHTAPYSAAPELAPLREVVRRHCAGLGGFAAGSCLSDLFAARFPNGEPAHEFFEREHRPAGVFAAHMAGQPGHCVSRSGMLAAALLASGFPARVVQILPSGRGEGGHNAVEIWEPGRGWLILDPSFAGSLENSEGRVSAVAATVSNQPPRWREDPSMRKVPGVDQAAALRHYDERRLLGAKVVYPEPWLYTRVGRSDAAWPLHGRFVVVGGQTLHLGVGQALLRAGLVASLLAAVLLLANHLFRAWRRLASPRPSAAVLAARGQSTS